MKEILKWIASSFISLLLPTACFGIGIILILYGLYLNRTVNDVGSFMIFIGIVLTITSLILPVYFLIKGLTTSARKLFSKNRILRISGLIGIILAVAYILFFNQQFFDFIKTIPIDMLSVLIFLLVILLIFLFAIYLIIKMALRLLYRKTKVMKWALKR